jgi:hypothetical protein
LVRIIPFGIARRNALNLDYKASLWHRNFARDRQLVLIILVLRGEWASQIWSDEEQLFGPPYDLPAEGQR